jgi:hypothetical protein
MDTAMDNNMDLTLDQLHEKFKEAWIRGTAWRLEVGELLYKIKKQCEHGNWGEFLNEYELARSTADDYIRRYEDEAQITEPRQFDVPNPDPDPDPGKDERIQDLEEEKNKRKGKKPTHHPTEVRPIVKNLTSDQLALYWEEKEENPERVNQIWQTAFFAIIEERMKAEDELVPDNLVEFLEATAEVAPVIGPRPSIAIQQEGGETCSA